MNAHIACLVPDSRQLEHMLKRIGEAGIDPRDVRIIHRPTWRPSVDESDPWTPPLAAHPWLAWWSLPYAQASLWWQWAAPVKDESPRPDRPTVIQFARYDACRRRLLKFPDYRP